MYKPTIINREATDSLEETLTILITGEPPGSCCMTLIESCQIVDTTSTESVPAATAAELLPHRNVRRRLSSAVNMGRFGRGG
jgi:hypothetical protein